MKAKEFLEKYEALRDRLFIPEEVRLLIEEAVRTIYRNEGENER